MFLKFGQSPKIKFYKRRNNAIWEQHGVHVRMMGTTNWTLDKVCCMKSKNTCEGQMWTM
jgi:hypothetical protein